MFPVPRGVEWTGGRGSTEILAEVPDTTLRPQGYELRIGAEGTAIHHRDEAGLHYARQTLSGLGTDVPTGRVADHPDHLVRGFMLDVSRDRVPTNETLAELVAVLARLRYNHLELYMEHTFAYRGHELVWRDASPLTAEDVAWLDRLCSRAGIELVANQNTFGHMERWLRHDEHRHRAECPDGAISSLSGRPMSPTTLAPTADNATFALSLVRELCGHLGSNLVNIGADEPFELGQGRSSAAVAERGRAAVYTEHLVRLLRPLIDDGRHVLFWGDVLRRHPELVAQLPHDGASAVVWNYEAPADDPGLLGALGSDLLESLGLPDDFHVGFRSHVRSFVETGYPFWVAPGTSSWNSLIGRWSNARENLLDAARVGLDAGAGGFLVTDWGDNGHLQPLTVSLLPLAYGAGVAWCADTNATVDVSGVVDELAGTPGLGALLIELGDAHALSGVSTFNGSPLFAALDPKRPLPLVDRGTHDGLMATADLIDAAIGRLDAMASSSHRDALATAVRLARHGAWRLAARSGASVPAAAAVAADRAEIRELHRRSWLASSRPGGLTDSLGHIP